MRIREPFVARSFCVPLYPILPLAFCLVCGYLLYSSLAYTGLGAIIGVGVVGLEVPLLIWDRHRK